MLAMLPARKLAEWRAYAALEPFDETRADWRAATIAAEVRNSGAIRNAGRPATANDYPYQAAADQPTEADRDAELWAKLQRLK